MRPDLSDAAPTGAAYFAPETKAVVNVVGPHLRGLLSSIVQKALERSARRGQTREGAQRCNITAQR